MVCYTSYHTIPDSLVLNNFSFYFHYLGTISFIFQSSPHFIFVFIGKFTFLLWNIMAKIKISASGLMADMLVLIYRYRYRQNGRIYRYWYRLDPYWSNPSLSRQHNHSFSESADMPNVIVDGSAVNIQHVP